ncbi:hypothetical protein P7K49_020235 [Saguinus oedipus]|uniref:Uncharacterized protein n=1 Tax=Saguinus oedipus TaxID=9490 RepID=A0ABQ9UZQ7_SAGOE|nr:hypothetical protein P7K49_020235 [Saguinus oedipus]
MVFLFGALACEARWRGATREAMGKALEDARLMVTQHDSPQIQPRSPPGAPPCPAQTQGRPSRNPVCWPGFSAPANAVPTSLLARLKAALYAAPYKSDFLKALSKGQNVTEEECLEKIRLFLVNYTATIDVIYEMYTQMNAELNYKV